MCGFNEVQLDAAPLRPQEHRFRRELGAVVTDDRLRQRSAARETIELVHDALAREREVDDLQHALAAEVIDDVEHPEPAAVGELIRHEVDRPALVDGAWHEHRDPRDVELVTAFTPHLEPFFAVNAIGALEVHDATLGDEHAVQRRAAVARVVLGELLEPFAQRTVVTPL